MKIRFAVRFAAWLAFVLACLAVIAGTRFTADMSAFLPAAPTPAQQLLVDQLRHGPVSRLLLIAIEGEPATSAARARLSQALAAALADDPAFAAVANGARPPGDDEQAQLFRHRYLLGDAVEAGRFTPQGLREAIGASLQALASPLGMAYRALLPRDPTGEMLRLMDRLQPAASPAYRDGAWSSADGRRALILAQLAQDGTELDAQEAALASVQRAFEAARAAAGVDARLAVSGTARFAVESRDRIRTDVARLSTVGMLLILLLLGSIYRSPRLLALGIVPVTTGALASVAAVSLVFGHVHGMTLGFGVALIGEAIDYAIYVFLQGSGRRLWRTIRLGVLTSLIGFSALLFSGFPGLAQLGLFAVTGILVAAAVTAGLLGPSFPVPPVAIPRWAPGVELLGRLAHRADRVQRGGPQRALLRHGDDRDGRARGRGHRQPAQPPQRGDARGEHARRPPWNRHRRHRE
jgi:predicted exporter